MLFKKYLFTAHSKTAGTGCNGCLNKGWLMKLYKDFWSQRKRILHKWKNDGKILNHTFNYFLI